VDCYLLTWWRERPDLTAYCRYLWLSAKLSVWRKFRGDGGVVAVTATVMAVTERRCGVLVEGLEDDIILMTREQ